MEKIRIKSGMFRSKTTNKHESLAYRDVVLVDKLEDKILFLRGYRENTASNNFKIVYNNKVVTDKNDFFGSIERFYGNSGEFVYRRKYHNVYTLDYFSNRILDTPKFFRPVVHRKLKQLDPKYRKIININYIESVSEWTNVTYGLINGRRKRCRINLIKLQLEHQNKKIPLESKNILAKVPLVY